MSLPYFEESREVSAWRDYWYDLFSDEKCEEFYRLYGNNHLDSEILNHIFDNDPDYLWGIIKYIVGEEEIEKKFVESKIKG